MSVRAKEIKLTLELNWGFCRPRTMTTNELPTMPYSEEKEMRWMKRKCLLKVWEFLPTRLQHFLGQRFSLWENQAEIRIEWNKFNNITSIWCKDWKFCMQWCKNANLKSVFLNVLSLTIQQHNIKDYEIKPNFIRFDTIYNYTFYVLPIMEMARHIAAKMQEIRCEKDDSK